MEEELAILIADLSGYTALTEKHGASSAADMVDLYILIVKQCLAGTSILQERKGDEVLITASNAEDLLATAILLLKITAGKENFLQVHGGIHYGMILKRDQNYFGAPINLAARITAFARPGTIWLSAAFKNKIKDACLCTIRPAGKHRFKNVAGEIELFELISESASEFYIDPVCRMVILNKNSATSHPQLNDIYFCSVDCREDYINGQK